MATNKAKNIKFLFKVIDGESMIECFLDGVLYATKPAAGIAGGLDGNSIAATTERLKSYFGIKEIKNKTGGRKKGVLNIQPLSNIIDYGSTRGLEAMAGARYVTTTAGGQKTSIPLPPEDKFLLEVLFTLSDERISSDSTLDAVRSFKSSTNTSDKRKEVLILTEQLLESICKKALNYTKTEGKERVIASLDRLSRQEGTEFCVRGKDGATYILTDSFLNIGNIKKKDEAGNIVFLNKYVRLNPIFRLLRAHGYFQVADIDRDRHLFAKHKRAYELLFYLRAQTAYVIAALKTKQGYSTSIQLPKLYDEFKEDYGKNKNESTARMARKRIIASINEALPEIKDILTAELSSKIPYIQIQIVIKNTSEYEAKYSIAQPKK